MRALVAVLVLLAIAGAAYFYLQQAQPLGAPPTSEAPPMDREAERTANVAQSERVGADLTNRPIATSGQPATGQTTPPPPPAPVPNETPVTLVLNVRNRITHEPIAAFRWRLLQPGAPTGALRGDAQASRVELRLPAASRGELLVEADGMQPFSQADVVIPTIPGTPLQLDVFLTPIANAEGITLWVKDLALAPVEHVRVDAFPITEQNRETSWQLTQPLWARHTSAKDGRYTLPPLPPGEFGILLVATDADGNVQPLLPYRRTFVLTGSNGYVEDVPLEPGCLLLLQLLEPNGQPFDATQHGTVMLTLRLAGGPPEKRMWTASSEAGEATSSAVDTVPGQGLIWPAEPMPAGTYTLEVFVNGDPRVRQPLTLRAGERQREQVVVH